MWLVRLAGKLALRGEGIMHAPWGRESWLPCLLLVRLLIYPLTCIVIYGLGDTPEPRHYPGNQLAEQACIATF